MAMATKRVMLMGDGDGNKGGQGWRATKWALATVARAMATATRLEGKQQHPGLWQGQR
jgi:hypothetical protein